MRPKAERGVLLFIAALMFALDLGMVWSFGLYPAVLLAPLLVLTIVWIGPNPRVTPWRDGLTVLLILTIVARSFVPREWPRELRFSLGSLGVSGVVLLFVAYSFGDGLGARMRSLSATKIGAFFRRFSYYSAQLVSLAFSLAIVAFLSAKGLAPRELATVPGVLVVAGLLPTRWSAITNAVSALGCAVLVGASVGALLSLWGWGSFWLLLWSTGIPQTMQKFREPVPAATPPLAEASA